MANTWDTYAWGETPDVAFFSIDDLKLYDKHYVGSVEANITDTFYNEVKSILADNIEIWYGWANRYLKSVYDDTTWTILDHIENTEELRKPAIYLALSFLYRPQALSQSEDEDFWEQRYCTWYREFKRSFYGATQKLRFDSNVTDYIVESELGQVRLAR